MQRRHGYNQTSLYTAGRGNPAAAVGMRRVMKENHTSTLMILSLLVFHTPIARKGVLRIDVEVVPTGTQI